MRQIIDRVEKENFGLKLKIHFLEESLRKTGPGLNEAALKENTDLKVDRVTLHRELVRCKKMLSQAERDVDALKRHVEDVQDRAKTKQADMVIKKELETLRKQLDDKEKEIERMRADTLSSEALATEVDRLKASLEEMEADLQEKDRLIDDRDDEIDNVRTSSKEDVEALEEELDEAKRKIDELQEKQDEVVASAADLEVAKKALKDAEDARDKAEADLDELRDEMANKSVNNKGLSRQLEEKGNRLQQELAQLRKEHAQLQEELSSKLREERRLQEQLQSQQLDADVQDQRLNDRNELLRSENESLKRRIESSAQQEEKFEKALQEKNEEKDLLHSRHDALTAESQQLQKDLTRAQSTIQQLQANVEEERQHALQNEHRLRSDMHEDQSRHLEELNKLRRELSTQESRMVAATELWESQRRNLEAQRDKAEEQAASLQRTISKLHETEGTLSNRETQLQHALSGEKERHQSEEAFLQRQIKDMNTQLEEKRSTIDSLRRDLSEAEENLRVLNTEQSTWEEKVQALEDEIEVLQAGMDDEAEMAQQELEDARKRLHALESELATIRDGRSHDDGEQAQKFRQQLDQTRSEKQTLQDQLAATKIELHALQSSMTDAEAERAQLQSDAKEMEVQLDEIKKRDQDNLGLRSSNSRLITEVNRLRAEQKSLLEKTDHLEKLLNKGDVQHEATTELNQLQTDLVNARQRELGFIGREAAQKEVVKGLKQQVTRLERQAHEAEIAHLTSGTPKSSDGSARKNEVVELRRQLIDSQQQIKEARKKSRENLQSSQKDLLTSQQEVQRLQSLQEQLELDLNAAQQAQELLQAEKSASDATTARLRNRVNLIEKDLRVYRRRTTEDDTMAAERKDLHDLLKDAKLEAEDLQNQLSLKESSMAKLMARETQIRSQLKRIRGDRSLQEQRSHALAQELMSLRIRHNNTVEQLAKYQQVWAEERREIMSRVRFPHHSISEMQDGATESERKAEDRHVGELRGLAKQIQWLKAKCQREKDFRTRLVFEKKFLLVRIGMFEAW